MLHAAMLNAAILHGAVSRVVMTYFFFSISIGIWMKLRMELANNIMAQVFYVSSKIPGIL